MPPWIRARYWNNSVWMKKCLQLLITFDAASNRFFGELYEDIRYLKLSTFLYTCWYWRVYVDETLTLPPATAKKCNLSMPWEKKIHMVVGMFWKIWLQTLECSYWWRLILSSSFSRSFLSWFSSTNETEMYMTTYSSTSTRFVIIPCHHGHEDSGRYSQMIIDD